MLIFIFIDLLALDLGNLKTDSQKSRSGYLAGRFKVHIMSKI